MRGVDSSATGSPAGAVRSAYYGTVSRRPAALPLPDPPLRRRFPRRPLYWYQRHRRSLPWRESRHPYRLHDSEIQLQQQLVSRVLTKYHEWLERYPTFEALSRADEEEVVRVWYPLGYNIRPRRLHAIARDTVERFGGTLPAEPEA